MTEINISFLWRDLVRYRNAIEKSENWISNGYVDQLTIKCSDGEIKGKTGQGFCS